MQWIAAADSHGYAFRLKDIAARHPGVAGLLFCGDGLNELPPLRAYFLDCIAVRGNCDLFSDAPEERAVTLGGQAVYLCHGHRWGVKHGLMSLSLRAEEMGARVAVFGHTHRPLNLFERGILFVNPGALANGRYALLTLDERTLRAELLSLDT